MAKVWICDVCRQPTKDGEQAPFTLTLTLPEEKIVPKGAIWNEVCETCMNRIVALIQELGQSKPYWHGHKPGYRSPMESMVMGTVPRDGESYVGVAEDKAPIQGVSQGLYLGVQDGSA